MCSSILLEKTDFLFPKRYCKKLLVTGRSLCLCPLLRPGILSGLNQCRSCVCRHSLCDMFEMTLRSFAATDSCSLYTSSENSLMKTSHLRLHVTNSLILWTLSSCGSLWSLPHFAKIGFSDEVEQCSDLWVEQYIMRSRFFTMLLWQNNRKFPLGTSSVSEKDSISHSEIKCNQRVARYPSNMYVTTPPVYLAGRPTLCSQHFYLGDTNDYFLFRLLVTCFSEHEG